MSRSSTPPPLSAKDPSSFAYPTMKDRIPVILSKIVDHLTRNKSQIVKEYGGESAREELKSMIGAISELRHCVMTNKHAKPIRDSRQDAALWNTELEKQINEQKNEAAENMDQDKEASMRWFDDAWLWMECYLYRRVQEAVLMCNLLKEYDVFGEQKKEAFHNSFQPMSKLTTYLLEVTNKLKIRDVPESQVREYFMEFLQMSLWGNKCDLSISAGHVEVYDHSPMLQLTTLKNKLLIDDTDAAYQKLIEAAQAKGHPGRVDIVLDNAGFELVTDLCLAEFLLAAGLASKVVFHAKSMPWFVSDVTMQDWAWTLRTMSQMNHAAISELQQAWTCRLNNGSWSIEVHDFWTMPNTFNEMQEISPDLYNTLTSSDLIFFKGDLNYRKLVSDRRWSHTTEFSRALRGFQPAPLCSLRTLKCDCVVGLQHGQAQRAESEDEKWMIGGNWAVISVCHTRNS